MQSPTFTSAETILARLLGVDGPGSLLNADLLDDKHASDFELAGAIAAHLIAANPHSQYLLASGYTAADVLSKLLGVDGAGSGLDADLLRGTTPTAFGLSLVDDADAPTARTTLGLVIGTNVQAQNTNLSALAGLTGVADKAPYFTGAGALALADFPTFGRSLVAAVSAAAGRTVLELGTMATQASTAYLLATGATTGATSQRQVFTNGITGPSWRPASDSTTALQLQNAAGTAVVTVDTTAMSTKFTTPNGTLVIGDFSATPGLWLNRIPNNTYHFFVTHQAGHTGTTFVAFENTAPTASGNEFRFMKFRGAAQPNQGDVVGRLSFNTIATMEIVGNNNTFSGNRCLDFIWKNYNAAGVLAEYMRLTAEGYLGIGTNAPTALLDIAASSATRASLRLRHGVAPTTPNDGEMWTSTAGLFVRINGVTVGPLT